LSIDLQTGDEQFLLGNNGNMARHGFLVHGHSAHFCSNWSNVSMSGASGF
jgi:hypothetical protein